MIKEHDRVVLTTSVRGEGLEPGDVGTVVHMYRDGQAYEVEFVTRTAEPRRWSLSKPHTFVPDLAGRSPTRGAWPGSGDWVGSSRRSAAGNRFGSFEPGVATAARSSW